MSSSRTCAPAGTLADEVRPADLMAEPEAEEGPPMLASVVPSSEDGSAERALAFLDFWTARVVCRKRDAERSRVEA